MWVANQEGGSTVSVDPTRAYRGTHSLHVVVPATASGAVGGSVSETQTFTPPPGTVFMRAFFFIPSPAYATTEAELFSVAENAGTFNGIALENLNNNLELFDNVGSKVVTTSTQGLPGGRWLCLEWQVQIASAGAVKVWLDGNEVGQLTSTQNTAATPPVAVAAFGLQYFRASVMPTLAQELWIDEVAVDVVRIGCDR